MKNSVLLCFISVFQLHDQCKNLQSRQCPSVLLSTRAIEKLAESGNTFFADVVLEMKARYVISLFHTDLLPISIMTCHA